MTKLILSPTQVEVLKQATHRPDGNIEPLPPTLRGGARLKVLEALLDRALVEQRADQTGCFVTDAGYVAVGRSRPRLPIGKAKPDAAKPGRENSKQALVIRMLQRSKGATLAQIMAATGWQPHTVRGTLAGALKKKLSLNIVSDKPAGGERIYRIG